MKFILLIFAVATLGAGAMLLPAVKDVSAAIFEAFNMGEIATPFLKVIISFWPVFILGAFVFGAVMLFKGRGG